VLWDGERNGLVRGSGLRDVESEFGDLEEDVIVD
jgi:hypothetical protein